MQLSAEESVIDLAGQWRFALDAENKGLAEHWYEKDLTGDTITLPATTDIAKKGTPNSEKLEDKLTRRYKFVGKAWYQRDITIPNDWKEMPLVLTLERTRHTTVWLDNTKLPDPHQSLSAPHRYSLPKVSGKCRLTILVDNDPKLFPAGGHMINEDIQTNWNGIIGEISLKTVPPKKTTSKNINADTGGKARLTRDGRQLLCGGEPFFLRGKCDSMEFPLTGVPPMDKASWLKHLTLCKSYGINHFRFHSCCPPEAAFAAADELGILFQVEGPMMWGRFHYQYQTAEAKAILDEYGHHPSFVIFSLGNEIGGNTRSELGKAVAELRQYDGNRRMFLTGTCNWSGNSMQHPADDVWVTIGVTKGAEGLIRASNNMQGHIENGPPNTRHDYTEALKFSTVPVIAHEIGQYQVFPNFDDIEKLTGVLEGRNLQIFKDRLEKAGMFERWKDFHRASLECAFLCYKEDIEAALRTESFGGFQILDLQDYQAYGPALVGIFNVLMEPKAPDLQKRWTQFCNDIVPLALFDKYVWEEDEKFSAEVKVANYSSQAVQATCLIECDGKSLSHGVELPKGKLTAVPVSFGMSFGEVKEPKKLTLTVSLSDGQKKRIAENSWNIWVYPKHTDAVLQKLSEGIRITASSDEAAALDKGNTVLLLNGSRDKTAGEKQGTVRIPGMFMTDFWNWVWFKKRSPGTLGLLCDPAHPVFADFPTDFHTNWNWRHLIKNSDNAVLDDFPKGFEPLVQMIDNVARNHKIGMIFECKTGSGKLLVCCIGEQTLRTRPEGRQLLVSMLKYMQSDKFQPKQAVEPELLKAF
jgi:hypothetical protein